MALEYASEKSEASFLVHNCKTERKRKNRPQRGRFIISQSAFQAASDQLLLDNGGLDTGNVDLYAAINTEALDEGLSVLDSVAVGSGNRIGLAVAYYGDVISAHAEGLEVGSNGVGTCLGELLVGSVLADAVSVSADGQVGVLEVLCLIVSIELVESGLALRLEG